MLIPEIMKNAESRVGLTLGGKWRLDRVIGVGGMAAVYEATHRNRNRVAIKMLHPTLSLDAGTRHRFLREGYVANTIRHEGAVQVLDDDMTEDGVAYLVMELLEGESVEERMNRKGGFLGLVEALQITEELLDVLAAAHDQGVVHRDIKPDNLFLTQSGRLKVLDFGIARLHQGDSSQTKVGSFMGTPAYCAPEQARGRWDEVDARTDLFSVGANLFACITGRHVHEAETSSEQLALAISATAPSLREALPDAPDELVELVDRALSYTKDERYQSARAMKAAVRRVRAGLGAVTDSSSPAVTSDPPSMDGPAYPAPGAITAIESDLFSLGGLNRSKTSLRVLVGLLVAGVLAIFLLIVNQQSPRRGASASEIDSPSLEKDRGRSSSPPATAASSKGTAASATASAHGDEVDAHPTSDSPAAGTAPPETEAGAGDTRRSGTSSPVQAPASAPSTSPSPSPPASPRPRPSPPVLDEDALFDSRH